VDDLTALIAAWDPGRGVPVDALWQAAYGELKKLARSSLRGSGELTLLPATALVNEAYLKLAGQGRLKVEGRRQFFAYCARVMRSVVLDLLREKQALRRGHGGIKLSLDAALEDALPAAAPDEEPLRVDAALRSLESSEPRLVQVVEMRYFAGFTEAEIAEILGVTERTVRRDWQKAKLMLRALLEP
jgi:RNA polymerase sigma factor (TIGR02999 family)